MATPRQIEANRRNAQKSTGPRSGAGKARSARNAIRYGPMPTLGPNDQPRIDAIVEALVGKIDGSREDAAIFARAQVLAERMELREKALLQKLLTPYGTNRIVHATALAPFYEREQRARRRRSRAFRKMIEGGGTARERR